jgi:hypothetical protein
MSVVINFTDEFHVKHNNKTHPKGVDELNPNVVAQVNVAMRNKSKATFRLPTVRIILIKNIAGEHNFYFSVRLDNIFPVLPATMLVNWTILFLAFD